ncbi:putative replicative DNA helicase [Vibrio phage VCPH]|nr:putative replicative DNA helicase [Vibrio phage VCPH]
MAINTQAVVLKLLLQSSQDSDTILEFDAAKPEYFSESYRKIRKHLSDFYDEYDKLPTLSEIRLKYSRSSSILATLDALDKQEIPEEIELDVAVDALKNEYTQQLILTKIKTDLLADITVLESEDLVERLNTISTEVMEAVEGSDKVFTGGQLSVFEDEEEVEALIVPTGISNRWDQQFGASRRQELVLIGGHRGSGKSVVSMNMAKAQWLMGNICPYFTIEMTGQETMQRFMTSIAGVNAMDYRNKQSISFDVYRIALARAKFFQGGEELLESYVKELEFPVGKAKLSDFAKFDKELKKLKEVDPKIVIVDDRELTISAIDAHLTQLKAKYGDRMTMAVVDYVNQVIVGDKNDMYDWKDQLQVAKALKNLARKHDIVIVSPYQVDKDGEARLSKAILDPADYAMLIKRHDDLGIIALEASKVRSISDVTFLIPMDWDTLTMSNEDLGFETVLPNVSKTGTE